MFSTPSAVTPGRPNPFANAYRQVGAETGVADASPHRLIGLLFDGVLDALAQARGALRDGQHEAKGRAIGRAVRIVEEGLRSALDLRGGGELAADLNALYGYLTMRLTLANLKNDESILEECRQLITPLRDAWAEIAPRVATSGR